MPRLTIVEHALGQTGQLTVVTGRQRGQRDFLVTGVLEHRLRLLEQHFLGLGAQRTISVAGLAESAAARTAAEQLDHRTVEHNIRRGHNEGLRIVHGIQILDDALLHECGCAVCRRNALNRAVLVVLDLVQRRYIHTLDLCCRNQEFLLRPAFALGLAVQIGKFQHDLLAVADHEQVNEVSQRLRIVGTRTAAGYNMLEFGTVLCQHRNTAEIQHIQNVGKRQLILQRKRDNIKVRQWVTALQTVQRQTGLAHFSLHVDPWRADAFAPDALLIIEQAVKDTRTEVRHGNLIGIRKTERKSQIDVLFIFHHRAPFTADVACRLLYTGQNGFHLFMQDVFLHFHSYRLLYHILPKKTILFLTVFAQEVHKTKKKREESLYTFFAFCLFL